MVANNELLRTIRDALHIDDSTMIEIFKLAGREVRQSTITALLKTEDEEGYIPCSDPIMTFFLDGLIILKRGRQEEKTASVDTPIGPLTRNGVLKKLRIALDLKENEMIEVFKLADIELNKNELTALFRKEGHKHYKECSPGLLDSFLKGLALRYRD